ncbi:MAG: tRNA 2-selenouridine(34) synthase MnmH [Saprospiraceae bacterium]|nr:tRNA 2-selenouridine(34) synthase MnmH [Saprospiraceae bacterium]MDW8483559.1 tRNA 2-selenouridine(34) synthase MnmH [Saprospiraceae bacterium]
MNSALPPDAFLLLRTERPFFDVRSPAEYARGHIPGAINLPLFTDEERARVGMVYKQQGAEHAFLLGLRLVGPKLEDFVRTARKAAPHRRVAVHCWRGGQRSQSMAWLFQQAGFEVITLEGGYKRYRQYVLEYFENTSLPLIVLGGKTGVGKTRILRALQRMGEQVIDLEALAHHKGSSFGAIGEKPQPTSEQFENELFDAIRGLDLRRRIWVENESRSIGRIYLPLAFWRQKQIAPLINIEVPFECRIQNLIADYAAAPLNELEAAFCRLEKRLGGLRLKIALEALQRRDFATAAKTALEYYDKTYLFELENSCAPILETLTFAHADPVEIAHRCLQWADKYHQNDLNSSSAKVNMIR